MKTSTYIVQCVIMCICIKHTIQCRVGQKSKPAYCCNNFIYFQPIVDKVIAQSGSIFWPIQYNFVTRTMSIGRMVARVVMVARSGVKQEAQLLL